MCYDGNAMQRKARPGEFTPEKLKYNLDGRGQSSTVARCYSEVTNLIYSSLYTNNKHANVNAMRAHWPWYMCSLSGLLRSEILTTADERSRVIFHYKMAKLACRISLLM
jgi:hypothetical protein